MHHTRRYDKHRRQSTRYIYLMSFKRVSISSATSTETEICIKIRDPITNVTVYQRFLQLQVDKKLPDVIPVSFLFSFCRNNFCKRFVDTRKISRPRVSSRNIRLKWSLPSSAHALRLRILFA